MRRCWRPDSNRQGLSPNNLWSCRVYQFRHASTNPAANIDNPRARRITTQEFRVARFIDSNLHAECTIIPTRPWSVLCGAVFAVWRRIEAPRLLVHRSSTVLDRLTTMADTLARLRNALADRYAIQRELGAGGMADGQADSGTRTRRLAVTTAKAAARLVCRRKRHY